MLKNCLFGTYRAPRHCRNAVAFACLKERHFPEAVPRFPQLPFRIASGSPDNLGTSPFVDASALQGTYLEILPESILNESALLSPVDQWVQEYSHKFLPIEVRVVYYLLP